MTIFRGAAFSPLGAILCMLTSLALYLFYRILYAPYHVHKQFSIKGPKPEPFWGSYSEVKKMKINNFIAEGQKKFGSFFGFYIGSRFNVVVCDRALIEDILVNHSEKLIYGGPHAAWSGLIQDSVGAPRNLRRLCGSQRLHRRDDISYAFNPQIMRQMAPVMNEGCSRLVERVAKLHTAVDVHRLYVNFTRQTIIATVLGEGFDSQCKGGGSKLVKALSEFMEEFRDCMSSRAEEVTVILSHFPLVRWVLVAVTRRMAVTRAHLQLRRAACKLVEERRSQTSPPQDVLQLLLETSCNGNNEDNNEGAGGRKGLSNQEVVGQAIELLTCGLDTTASALSSISYELAQHPTIQDRVQNEIDDFFTKKPKKSVYDASQKSPYLKSVIQETLRLHPPIPMIVTRCEENIELERNTLPKGADIYIPTFLVHKSPDYWPQPYRFDPKRFSDEERLKREEMTHMPFGAGQHNCVGSKFALTLIKMALISILRYYTFVLSPKTEVPLQVHHGDTDTPLNGVVLLIVPRNTPSQNSLE